MHAYIYAFICVKVDYKEKKSEVDALFDLVDCVCIRTKHILLANINLFKNIDIYIKKKKNLVKIQ